MPCFQNPLVVQQVKLQNGIWVTFNASMGTADDVGIENLQTDLLVVTQMTDSRMSGGMEKIDAKLNLALSKAITEKKFEGRSGEMVLLDCRSTEHASQKYILLVGLGRAQDMTGKTACGLMRRAMEVAKTLGVKKITMPIMPNRQSVYALNLAGSAAIMVCRAATFGQVPSLEEIELFCTPQARRFLQDGLLTRPPHCTVCDNPELGK